MTGYFESNGAGAELTSAAVIRSGRTPLQGRFSLSGAIRTFRTPLASPVGSVLPSDIPVNSNGALAC